MLKLLKNLKDKNIEISDKKINVQNNTKIHIFDFPNAIINSKSFLKSYLVNNNNTKMAFNLKHLLY